MKLKRLFDPAGIDAPEYENLEIKGLTRDSKAVKEGFLFFASKGLSRDGKEFIDEAFKKGAAAAVIDKEIKNKTGPCFLAKDFEKTVNVISKIFYGDPSSFLYCAGITGTKGKTTVSYFLEKAFSDFKLKPAVIGTVNYRAMGKITYPAPNTTPSEPMLSETIRSFLDIGCASCIMEISSHALALKRTENINFDAALFTNLQSDHMDFHKTREDYAQAKRKLFKSLSESSKKNKIAVINADDEAAELMASACSKDVKIIFYGTKKKGGIRAENIAEKPEASYFDLKIEGKRTESVSLKMIGEHNIYNFLAAASLLYAKGFAVSEIIASLENFSQVPGRLEKIESSLGFYIFIDYAHTEQSLISVLKALRKSGPKRIITVFGCGGNRDKSKRAPMGKAACELSDLVFITSDNPRTENPQSIIKDIEEGVKDRFSNYSKVTDRKEAIFQAIKEAKNGDFILIAGKGHENYQIIGNEKIRFDDKETAMEAMEKQGKI